jgi:tetratricopeptide (TPR) repeat protein
MGAARAGAAQARADEDALETVGQSVDAGEEAAEVETVGDGVGEEENDLLPDPGDGNEPVDEPTPADLSEGLSAEECVSLASDAKAAGNDLFKAGENAEACQKYQLGVQYLRRHSSDAGARELLLSVQTNLAAAQIRLELWEDAVAAATAALDLDPSSAKALFRRGVARSRLSEWDRAKTDLTAACRADPRNRDARAELAVVQSQLAQMREAERERLSKLFAGKSLYAAEDKERKRREAEEARAEERRRAEEAEAEAALRAEWQAECHRLRREEAERRESQREAAAAAAEARAGGVTAGGRAGEAGQAAGLGVGESAGGEGAAADVVMEVAAAVEAAAAASAEAAMEVEMLAGGDENVEGGAATEGVEAGDGEGVVEGGGAMEGVGEAEVGKMEDGGMHGGVVDGDGAAPEDPPPISFEDYKADVEEKRKAAKAAADAAEEEARAEARRAKAAKEKEEALSEDEELTGLVSMGKCQIQSVCRGGRGG